MKVFVVSDVHVDYQANKHWLAGLSNEDYQNDVLILAGDLTDNLKLLEECFTALVRKFHQVLFVPGNHELWVARDPQISSVEKFHRVNDLALDCGIRLQPLHEGSLSIVPLLSWYDFSFAEPGKNLIDGWMDFRACRWPDHPEAADVNRFFLARNLAHLGVTNEMVISFSHFMPRIDLMPSYVPHGYRYLYPVLGSTALEEQVRRLNPSIHVYGHSHLNRHVIKDGIQYINNAFGYPAEERITSKRLISIYET